MDNKTKIFDVQQEIAELKRRVAYLESLDPNYGKSVAYSLDCIGKNDCNVNLPRGLIIPGGSKPCDFEIKENKLDS